MDFFEKIDKKTVPDLSWNLPERKQGTVKIIGGNDQSFRTEIKTAEYMAGKYSIEKVMLVLPESLKTKLPELPNVKYVEATESGSYGDAEELKAVMEAPDYNLVLGDLSKNTMTLQMMDEILGQVTRPTVVTRDAVDAVADGKTEQILMNSNLILMASMPQLIKIFRAVYYPKMLLITQSLVQVADALHKFTLSFPVKIVTLHNGQILIAENGDVKVIDLEKTGYQPFSFWNGEVAAKVVALNMFNPGRFLEATICGIWS